MMILGRAEDVAREKTVSRQIPAPVLGRRLRLERLLDQGTLRRVKLAPVLFASVWMVASALADEPPRPLPFAHAHNDYEHPRPLLEALEQGFCSVEADVHLVDGRLLVAHDRWQVKPERTLQTLYLDALRERVTANRGRVYRDGPPFYLLIDFKTAAEPTWAALAPVLEDYAEMLTEFTASTGHVRAVTVVLSGNSPRAQVAALPRRLAALDGRLPDLDANPSPHLVPWLSENWNSAFRWRGEGEMPADEFAKLRDLVQRAHQQGRKVRFWGAPDVEAMWRTQRAAGVDFINTDRLADLHRFFSPPSAANP